MDDINVEGCQYKNGTVQIQYHMVGTPLRGRRINNSQDYSGATQKKEKRKEKKGEEKREGLFPWEHSDIKQYTDKDYRACEVAQ